MSKKLILYGMAVRQDWLKDLMRAGVLLCYFLLISPLSAVAETCAAGIDYNKPTIAGGATHTVGIKEDGTVVGTGDNYFGQLNISDWTNIKAIAAGGDPRWMTSFTVGLKEDGTVVGVGDGNYGQLDVSGWTNIKAIAAGWGHTVGLKDDGTVVALGYGAYGQTNVSGWTNIKAIAAGWFHTVGLKEDGTVVVAGDTGYGQSGVSGWTNIKAIAAGHWQTVGLKEDGTVVITWPYWYDWQGYVRPLSGWSNFKAIAAGEWQTVGLKEDGTVVIAWPSSGPYVLDWTNITAIAAGKSHTIGLKEDGTVVAVGANESGQLNVSDWTNIRQPACFSNEPIASAGPDQVVECAGPSGASVTLNSSGSSDPDGDPLTYTWTWDGGSAEGVNPTIILPLGTTVVTLTVSDGNSTATDTVVVTVQDTIPPLTAATGGSENWYNANVISTFSATDSCSGVKEIHYAVNGVETVVPGSSASVVITSEGTNTITYFAVDNAGNSESPKSMTVKIDKTPPVLNLSSNPNILWPSNRKMVDAAIGGGASDNLSGLASVAFAVIDEYGLIQPTISGFNTSIALEAWRDGNDKDGRRYTITVTATDVAGNKSTATTEILVPHDQR